MSPCSSILVANNSHVDVGSDSSPDHDVSYCADHAPCFLRTEIVGYSFSDFNILHYPTFLYFTSLYSRWSVCQKCPIFSDIYKFHEGQSHLKRGPMD